MRARRAIAATVVALAGTAGAPASAAAHGLVGRADLPIPTYLFGYGAAAVLVLSFLGLAFLWPRPRLQDGRERRVAELPRGLDAACGVIGVAIFLLVVVSGFAGSATATDNLAPTFVYVIFWVALVPLSVLLGDVFAAFNPWRAMARAARAIAGDRAPAPLPYPARLGRWPAVGGIFAFAWLELVFTQRTNPRILAGLALGYCVIQLIAMSVWGIERWTERGDAFATYFGLFGRLSPLRWGDRALWLRRPLSRVTSLDVIPGTVALVCTMIGSTSFDGLSSTSLWTGVQPHLRSAFSWLGAAGGSEAASTIGLLVMIALISAFFRLGAGGMAGIDGRVPAETLAGRFAHTLVPIAVAYVLAHYFSLLAFQGQALSPLASDPLGLGSNLLGTAGTRIDYGVVSAAGIWYTQVVALVTGHVCGLILAHDRALATYRSPRDATRSQVWMLVVMVGFTSLALWLLASINA